MILEREKNQRSFFFQLCNAVLAHYGETPVTLSSHAMAQLVTPCTWSPVWPYVV